MPVDPNIRAMMDVLDEHAPDIGSGGYTVLANHLKTLSTGIEDKEACARRALARDMIVEKPDCIGALAVYPYIHNAEFMQGVVRAKAHDLLEYPTSCAAVLGSEWKQQLANAVLDNDTPELFLRVRLGVLSLLLARSGFLPQIVTRLAALKITPVMLFAEEFDAPLHMEDTGEGPTALEMLSHEPRFLRWLLGLDPTAPWPKLGKQPAYARRLVRLASMYGGDDPSVNAPCECPMCQGLAIPTMENDSTSFVSVGSEPDDEGYQSPVPLPPSRRQPAESVQRPRAMRARAATRPYHRGARG